MVGLGRTRFIRFGATRGLQIRKTTAVKLIAAAKDALTMPDAAVARAGLALLAELDAQMDATTAELARLVPPLRPFRTLLTVPGCGAVRAGNDGGALGDPARFPTSRQVYRTAGLNFPGIDGGFHNRRMEVMAAPRKYSAELRERAMRFALDLAEAPERLSVNAACKRVGEQLGIVPHLLRNWVQQARIDAGTAPGLATDERVRLAELERDYRELRRANAILKSASAFFSAELDRPSQR